MNHTSLLFTHCTECQYQVSSAKLCTKPPHMQIKIETASNEKLERSKGVAEFINANTSQKFHHTGNRISS